MATFHRRLPLAALAVAMLGASAVPAATPGASTAPPDAAAAQQPPGLSKAELQAIRAEARAAARHAGDTARFEVDRAIELALAEGIPFLPPSLAFVASEFGDPREIVKNAPYQAEAVIETTQVLQDGNRIVKKSTTLLARGYLRTHAPGAQERHGRDDLSVRPDRRAQLRHQRRGENRGARAARTLSARTARCAACAPGNSRTTGTSGTANTAGSGHIADHQARIGTQCCGHSRTHRDPQEWRCCNGQVRRHRSGRSRRAEARRRYFAR